MANFIDVSGLTYCGSEAQEIFTQDIYDLDLRGYGITFRDNVKGKVKLYNGELSTVWQEYTCPFTPEGEASLGEADMEPAAIKVNMENCYDVFWDTYLVEQTEISLRGGIPQTFAEWFFARLRKEMSKEYQEMFWKGDEDYSGTTKEYLKVVDGIEKKLGEAAEVISGAAITVDNAVAQVEAAAMKAIEVAAAAEVDVDGYTIFMNYNDARILKIALGKLCCGNSMSDRFSNYGLEGDVMYVMGFKVVPTMQSAGTIIVGPARNLVLGYDTFDSHLEYKLIDMRETTGDNMFRIIAISNIAVGVVAPELFVISKA